MKVAILFLALVLLAQADIFLGEDQHTGFIQVRDDGDDLFYWLMRSRGDKDNDPLVIWLTGGPGCASELAVMYENGPWKINADLSLRKNPYSWNTNANIVFIDQPLGTGYSKGKLSDLDKNETAIAEDFYTFLTRFIDKYTEYVDRPMFITGESYAGHYIPRISSYILKQKNPRINLLGAAIGNGWVDPYDQYPEYVTFALENKLISKNMADILANYMKSCQELIKDGEWEKAMEICNIITLPIVGPSIDPKFNPYDIRIKCEKPPLCYDFSNLDKFLKRSDVQAQMNTTGIKWHECSQEVHSMLLGDWMTNLQDDVTYLLENGMQVLVYSGDYDYICNWRGGEKWTNTLEWYHQKEFNDAKYQDWTDGAGTLYGQFKQVDNFVFLRVYNAGHMVPMDQPVAALYMLQRFLGGWQTNNLPNLQNH